MLGVNQNNKNIEFVLEKKREDKNSGIPKEIGVLSDDAQNDVKETEDDLKQLSSVVLNLKSIATHMGEQIDEQNVRLDHLGKAQEDADLRIRHQKIKIRNAM